jgi:hypothetical protein
MLIRRRRVKIEIDHWTLRLQPVPPSADDPSAPAGAGPSSTPEMEKRSPPVKPGPETQNLFETFGKEKNQ